MSDEFQKQLERTSKLQAKLCPVNGTEVSEAEVFLPDKSLINGNKNIEENGTEHRINGESHGKGTVESPDEDLPLMLDLPPNSVETRSDPEPDVSSSSDTSELKENEETEDNEIEEDVNENEEQKEDEIKEKKFDREIRDEQEVKEKEEQKDDEKDADQSDSSSDSHSRDKHYTKRITRKSTGSLPKEPKTLLSETTEQASADLKKSVRTTVRKPGHYIVIAPECTACGSDVILRPFKRKMLIHPIIKTVICRQCHEFYHSDVFELDEEGSEIYCVWCGEGGELIYCGKCEKAYCSDCIKRNFGRKKKDQFLNDDNWRCVLCVPGSLKKHLEISKLVVKYQNLCIKDPILVKLFECEVKKSELEDHNATNYQMIVSEKIKDRHMAQLMSLSQQKAASQIEYLSVPEDNESENDNSEASEEKSEKSNSDDEDFEQASKGNKHKKKSSSDSDAPKHKSKKGKKSDENNSSDDVDDDDAAFIDLLRKKTKKRREPTSKDTSTKDTSTKKKEPKMSNPDTDSKDLSEVSENEGSDDSLFTTGNPLVSTRRLRKKLDSDSGEDQMAESDDDDDEMVKKYKNKLSEYKEVISDEKESDYKMDSSDVSSAEDENQSEATSSSERSSSEDKEIAGKHKNKASPDEADDNKKRSKKRKKKRGNASEHSSDDEPKSKKRRKRRKKKKGSSDSEDSTDEEPTEKKKREKGKRHDIRKVMSKNKLKKETIEAQEKEEKRRKKLKEKTLPSEVTKLTNFVLEDLRKEKNRSKPITFEDQDEGRVIEVHKSLKKKLKPHQLDGIQFMYDCCIESVKKVKSGEPGSGCILAHCMGLGKTLQVIAFVTTILEYHHMIGLKKMLVVCPLNTVRNWKAEFDKWLVQMDDPPDVSVLSDNVTNNEKRAEILDNWYGTSGVLIMGYTLYRILSQSSNIKKKSLKEIFKKCLVDPGPDICVCDEGHIIKNEKTGISRALSSMVSKRRIILTGTPLQNNLVEYHCMVSYVKPNLLGTTKEFKNMYENPINNGSCADATHYDIKLMKERSHILFEQLSGCVQRRDYNVLREFLPAKYEYVLSIKLSDLQVKLYQKFLNEVKGNGRIMSKIFESYQTLKKIWTHPWLLEADMKKKDYDSLEEFITDGTESEASWEASSDDSDFRSKKKKKKKHDEEDKDKKEDEDKSLDDDLVCLTADEVKQVNEIADTIIPMNNNGGVVDPNWFRGDLDEKDEKMLEHSGKLLVTLEILDKASQNGEKVLLFSQSLLALDFLETTINRVGWSRGRDYFRMDGSTKTEHRSRFQKQFNDKHNRRCRLFLISTKAGGLGINLVAANRIILFDMSWNPSDDTQSLFRAYRFGQLKTVYVYRLVARGTMEEKIYDRQVYKESLSSRVVDEKQISRYFSANDLQELFSFDPSQQTCTTSILAKADPPADEVLASIIVDMDPPVVIEYHEHDSLLEHREDQQLTEEERTAAWANFKADKERRSVVGAAQGNASVFQRLKEHTQYQVISPIYSNQQELIIGGFSNDQILSIQAQLAPVVASGRLHVRHLGGGQLHISGLAPDQQQVFLKSIQQQQQQYVQTPAPLGPPAGPLAGPLAGALAGPLAGPPAGPPTGALPLAQLSQSQGQTPDYGIMQQRLAMLMKAQQDEQARHQLLLEQMREQQQSGSIMQHQSGSMQYQSGSNT